ncbi:uncharacterized protein EDB91DRAFT_1079386 [Suillus paluster]|uniref:uncharacterized protein n=1 Tax=Suillus paluster TaxID=48578 RepID=UPI001B886C2B|nr:uncharacterized protein EDB91DRAFT_1079386 [Suillus paluster]KAG1748426.1 hypothetical protein EDB91DRAFT_1079386 [Suillus paluster]
MLNLGLLLCMLISCTFLALSPALSHYLAVVTLAFTYHNTCQKTCTCWYPWVYWVLGILQVQVEFSGSCGFTHRLPDSTLTTAIKNFGDSFVTMATKHMASWMPMSGTTALDDVWQ